MDEILAGIAEEERVTEGLTWKEFLLPANRWRMFIVITLQIGKDPVHYIKSNQLISISRRPTYRKHIPRLL